MNSYRFGLNGREPTALDVLRCSHVPVRNGRAKVDSEVWRLGFYREVARAASRSRAFARLGDSRGASALALTVA